LFHNLIARGQSTSDGLDIRADNLNPYQEILLTGGSVSLLCVPEVGSVTKAYHQMKQTTGNKNMEEVIWLLQQRFRQITLWKKSAD